MSKIKTNIPRVLSYAVTLGIMIIIFGFSAQTGEDSASVSLAASGYAARFIFFEFNTIPDMVQTVIIDGLHMFVRKLAHFCVYAALGVSVFISAGFTLKKIKSRLIGSLCICAGYAAFDEIHQLFVSGRAGMLRDFFIDTAGAAAGILFAVCIWSVYDRLKG